MAQTRAVLGGSNFARNARVIERGHIDKEASGQRDVTCDARALLAERLLGDLNDDFLALLEQSAMSCGRRGCGSAMTVTAMAVLRAAAASAAAAIDGPAVASAAARGCLHARAEIVADARFSGWRCARLPFGGLARVFSGGRSGRCANVPRRHDALRCFRLLAAQSSLRLRRRLLFLELDPSSTASFVRLVVFLVELRRFLSRLPRIRWVLVN